jgi:hypothetical protein
VLRCQAQLELIFMMCLSDRSTSTGAFSDCSTFTSTDARATDLHHYFFGGLVVVWGRGCLQELKLSPPYLFIFIILCIACCICYSLIGVMVPVACWFFVVYYLLVVQFIISSCIVSNSTTSK